MKTVTAALPFAITKIPKVIAEQSASTLGKRAINNDLNQTQQTLVALPGRHRGTFTSKATVDEGNPEIARQVDRDLKTVSLYRSAIVAAYSRLCELRYAFLPASTKANKKRVSGISPGTLGFNDLPPVRVITIVEASVPHPILSGVGAMRRIRSRGRAKGKSSR